MTIILFKLFLMCFTTLVVSLWVEFHTAGKYADFFCSVLALVCFVVFVATICSFIWFF